MGASTEGIVQRLEYGFAVGYQTSGVHGAGVDAAAGGVDECKCREIAGGSACVKARYRLHVRRTGVVGLVGPFEVQEIYAADLGLIVVPRVALPCFFVVAG